MAGFIDEFMKSYGPEVTNQLSANLNVDKGTVQTGTRGKGILGGLL